MRCKVAVALAVVVVTLLAGSTASFAAGPSRATSAASVIPPPGDLAKTVTLPSGAVMTTISGPDKVPLAPAAPATVTQDGIYYYACSPHCTFMPPAALGDQSSRHYSALNGNVQANINANLNGWTNAINFECSSTSTVGQFYWWGSTPALYWSAIDPSLSWNISGLNVSLYVPAGVGFSGAGGTITLQGGQAPSGWETSLTYAQAIQDSANLTDTCGSTATATMWIGGNGYGISSYSYDNFGPVA